MNYFQAQDNARKKTWQLTAMFVAAVVFLIIATNLILIFAYSWLNPLAVSGLTFSQQIQQIPPDTWLWVSLGVVGTVAAASAYKYLSLQGGGCAVAESLGGQLIHGNTSDYKQRQLLNIVEEMAIASGISVPPVYLIPESSINAFAAGFSPDDAVIGINQGTLDLLNREELQGVVAHEFSHILNADTGINLRLMAILHGILFIGMIGYGVMRGAGFSRRNGLPVIAVGVGLLIVGYGGTFFGNLIKSAVSRQREYLADASAVQFTRNPQGIANALKKIGGATGASFMQNKDAEQASHMFFGAALPKFASSIFATHPPLEQRIRAIEPNWNGQFDYNLQNTANTGQLHDSPVSQFSNQPAQSPSLQANQLTKQEYNNLQEQQLVEHIGAPQKADLEHSAAHLQQTPQLLIDAAHSPFSACSLIYALLLHDNSAQPKQISLLAGAPAGTVEEVLQLADATRDSSYRDKLVLVELSMPALKELSKKQYEVFNRLMSEMIVADKQVDLFEWVLHRILTKGLYAHFVKPQNLHGNIKNINKVKQEAAYLLAVLASDSHSDTHDQQKAYSSGCSELDITIPYAAKKAFDYQLMNNSLAQLRKLHPLTKPALIKACVATALSDGQITDQEYVLLQGISATLDCPLPALHT